MLALCHLIVRYCVILCVGASALTAINIRKIVKNKKDSLCYLLCYFLCRFFVNTFEHFRFFVRLFPPFCGGDTRPFLCGFLRFFRLQNKNRIVLEVQCSFKSICLLFARENVNKRRCYAKNQRISSCASYVHKRCTV